MKISKLTIENFRSIRRLEIVPGMLCALVGPNNAGKSNILTALNRILGRDWLRVSSFTEEDVYARDPETDISIAITVEPSIEYSRFKYGDKALLSKLTFEFTRYKVGDKKGERRLEQQCFDDKGRTVQVLKNAPQKGKQREYQPLVGIPEEVRYAIPLVYIGTNRTLKNQLPAARGSLLGQLLEDINRDFHDPKNTTTSVAPGGGEVNLPRSEQFRVLIQGIMDLLRTDEFVRLEKQIKEGALRQLGFDPIADADKLDFFFAPFETMDFYKALDLRVKEGGYEIAATELGEGFQNAIVIAILQAFEERRKKGALLLIEEPEMFLHPQMQRSLYKTLRRLSETNQVIYTTHSPHFVSVPDYQNVLLVRRGEEGTTARPSDLAITTSRREKLLKELDPERSELFFATRLLLVEGDTEKLALPEYARRLSLDLDRSGATIVEVGGKRNLREFVFIASSFEIPTGILYDEDSRDFDGKKEEEEKYNRELDSLARVDGSVRVWRLSGNYETNLRNVIGENQYQTLCQKHSMVGKPTKARLIAMEQDTPIPPPFEAILQWLAGGAPSKL